MGDGGSAADPQNAGQRLDTLLGKLLRIDVDAGGERPYGIPADNPFVATDGARPEVFAYGLRNPWRFSFDRGRPERLFVGDVGQNLWEEVDLVRRGDNCGWRLLEGTHPFDLPAGADTSRLTPPIAEYSHRVRRNVLLIPFAHLSHAIADPAKAKKLLHELRSQLQDLQLLAGAAGFGSHKVLELKEWVTKAHPGDVAFRDSRFERAALASSAERFKRR